MSKWSVNSSALGIGAMAFICVSSAAAYEGRLLDGTSGKPVADAWVIGHWTTGGGLFAHGGNGCRLAVTKTNAKGEFTLVNRDGLFGWLIPVKSQPDISFYKRGMKQKYPAPTTENNPFMVEPESRTTLERLKYLAFILARTDCGTEYTVDHGAMLLPLYKDIYAEAKASDASTQIERNMVTGTAWPMLLAEFGYERASQFFRQLPTE
jgi:hypothetical protein